MVPDRKPFNPFYALLILVGLAFLITAFAYFVMTVQLVYTPVASNPASGAGQSAGFMQLINQHGTSLLFAELVLLTLFTAAAMATDSYWSRKIQPATQIQSSVENERQPVD